MPENLVPAGVYCVGIPAPLLAQGMTELSHSELRVLLYIYLHTLGYQKTEDSLTYNQMISGIITRDGRQLDKGAGISRRSLVEALAGLENKGYIKRQAGANTASSKIKLCFDAPEFQETTTRLQNQEEKQPEPESETTQISRQRKKQAVQKSHLLSVQLLHSSCKNQHVLNHGDEKTSSEPYNLNQASQSYTDCYTDCLEYQPGIDYLIQHIPNLAESDAQHLAYIALIKHGRNLDYLRELTSYVLSNPKIHTPAAVMTKLVKGNSDRIVPISLAGKITKFTSPTKAVRPKTPPSHSQVFPYASKFLTQQALSASVESAVLRENSTQLGLVTTQNKSKRRSSKNQNTGGALGVQTMFDWNALSTEITAEEVLGTTLPVSRVTQSDKVTVKSAIPNFPAPSVNEQTLPVLDIALMRLQDDVAGRLKYSVSPQLENLLKAVELECLGSQTIRLKFESELAERLVTQQDWQIIKLSLRQSLGDTFAVVIGEDVRFNFYQPTRQNFELEQAI